MKARIKISAPSLYYLSKIHRFEIPVTKKDNLVTAEMVFDTYGDAVNHITRVSDVYCQDTGENPEQFIDNLEMFGFAKLDNMVVSIEDICTGEVNTLEFTEFLLDHPCSLSEMQTAIELLNEYLQHKQTN